MNIAIDRIFCSGFKRALQSAALIKTGYQLPVEIELNQKLHEKGGCRIGGECRPGLSKAQAMEIIPELVINEG